jgi:hypothetical protein
MLGEAQNLPNGGEPAKIQIKGCYCEKANRHPHWGGDVPGLNSVIKTVTYRSSENAIEVIGLRRG